MANTVIKASQMHQKKTIADPQTIYHMLGSTKWVYDFGLRRMLTEENGERQADHIFGHRRHNTLIELMQYLGFLDTHVIAKYYDFPDPEYFSVYIDWVWNDVAADNNWKGSGLEQINYFPHHQLYVEFCTMMKNKGQ